MKNKEARSVIAFPLTITDVTYIIFISGYHHLESLAGFPKVFVDRASFAPKSSSFIKLMLVNFQVIWTSFGSLKHQNIENRVFCQCRVNSRKIGKL